MSNITPQPTHNYTPRQKVRIETGMLAAAELASIGVSLGVVAVADQVAPGGVKACSKVLSKIVFEPYLDYIEGALAKVCKLEECQIDKTKSREERAELLSKTTLVFSAAFAASMLAKLGTRRVLNNHFHLDPAAVTLTNKSKSSFGAMKNFMKTTTHEKIIFGLDEGVHVGSFLLMNTAAAKQTDTMIVGAQSMLQKMGFSKEKAHEISAMTMVWEVPNLLGMLSGVVGINGIHRYDWDKKLDKKWAQWVAKKPASHVEQALSSTSLSTQGVQP